LAKPNYRHAKKQKEAARKARQDAKQQRKASLTDAPAGSDAAGVETPGAHPDTAALVGEGKAAS
jgi:hypothetical protein